jgi:hypothetical protein
MNILNIIVLVILIIQIYMYCYMCQQYTKLYDYLKELERYHENSILSIKFTINQMKHEQKIK